VAARGPALAQPTHVASPTAIQREAWLRARRALASAATGSGSGTETEGVKDVDPEMLAFLAGRGEIVKVGDAVFLPEAVLTFATAVVGELGASGKITVARARDITASSRKQVLPLLQFLDDHGLTRRIGDDRVLVHPPDETLARLRSLLLVAGRREQMERETPV
jgi:selenocysteine-specific elongation factor